MSFVPTTPCWGLAALAVLAFVGSTIQSQTPKKSEIRNHLAGAKKELIDDRGLDPKAKKRVEAGINEAFSSFENGKLNREDAANRLKEIMIRENLTISRDDKGFKLLPASPEDSTIKSAWADSYDVVDSLASVIRRQSVLDEIGAAASRTLDHTQLREYLKNSVKIADYHEVTESFDAAVVTQAITLDKPTTLLRRFCCKQRRVMKIR